MGQQVSHFSLMIYPNYGTQEKFLLQKSLTNSKLVSIKMLTRCNQTETFLLIEKTNTHCLSFLFRSRRRMSQKGFQISLLLFSCFFSLLFVLSFLLLLCLYNHFHSLYTFFRLVTVCGSFSKKWDFHFSSSQRIFQFNRLKDENISELFVIRDASFVRQVNQ